MLPGTVLHFKIMLSLEDVLNNTHLTVVGQGTLRASELDQWVSAENLIVFQ